MSSDRWRRAEGLCHAALADRAEERRAFLADACQDDEGLLREDESLLGQESGAEGFMSVPAAALAGSAGREEPAHTHWRALRLLHDPRIASALLESARSTARTTRRFWARSGDQGAVVGFTAEAERPARFEREAGCSRPE